VRARINGKSYTTLKLYNNVKVGSLCIKKVNLLACFTMLLIVVSALAATRKQVFYFASAYSSVELAENSWTTKASMPSTASGCKAAILNGKIYVVGVSYNYEFNPPTREPFLYEYNPATNTWIMKKPMPTPRNSFGVATYQNKIYVIGGNLNGTNTGINEVYDPAADTWETKSPMPTPRQSFEANAVDGKIYVIGGHKGVAYSSLFENEVYDPATDSWDNKSSIPHPVFGYMSATLDNKIYVISGQSDNPADPGPINRALNQIYDIETDTWSQRTPFPVGTWLAAAGATTGEMAPKRIYVFGGEKGFLMPDNSVYVYNPKSDFWSTGTPMPTNRSSLAVAVLNDILYAIGGRVGWQAFPGGSTSVVEQYTPFGYGSVPPSISVISPENKTHVNNNVSLIFNVNKPVTWMGYSLDGQDNVTTTENTTIAGLASGLHNITVYAKDAFENMGASETIIFSIAKESEPFPTTLVVAISGASVAIIGIGLIVYFKKRKC
jgi:N-acetylneuraminic acid mutarotase